MLGYVEFAKELEGYKLVYEMNFDCSICLENLNEIYDFYLLLSRIRELVFCVITPEKSHGYIKFFLDDVLKDYALWIIQQKFTN